MHGQPGKRPVAVYPAPQPVLGREGTLVVAPFCDLSHGSSARLTWSAVAQGLAPSAPPIFFHIGEL